jgi:hypothetical protein
LGVNIFINLCCHQYPFHCDCGHTAILACHAAKVSTRHRSPAPVLQHLVPATTPFTPVAIKHQTPHQHRDTSSVSDTRRAPYPTLRISPPPVASAITLILFFGISASVCVLASRLSRLDSSLTSEVDLCDLSATLIFSRRPLVQCHAIWLMVLFRRV